jgi:hypothetical protein
MDPYIEQRNIWVDFHADLASEIRAQLNAQIRPTYFARLTPYSTYEVVEIAQSRIHAIRPDVGVLHRREPPVHAGPKGRPVAVLDVAIDIDGVAPVESMVALEAPLEILSVEILQTDNEVLVTAIEILSPVNKQPGHDAHADYLRKRRELLRSDVHLIEIDLLRGGERPPLEAPVPPAPYYITLSRAQRRPFVVVWPIPLNARLPTIPVPLNAPDPDVPLKLNEIVVAVYERGGYDVQIDYRQPPPPPDLWPEEVAWVERLLAEIRG